MTIAARVAGLYRYPVQSVRGEELTALDFGLDGIPGNRFYGIADLELGCIAHASGGKRQYRPLITWSARYLEEPGAVNRPAVIELDFGDGSLRSDDARIDAVISDRLGMSAALVINGDGRVPKLYELSHCHLLTTATLKRLQEHHPAGNFAPARFRPSIFLDCGDTVGFLEETWMGQPVAIGSATFDVNDVCKRCALTTRAQGDLPDDPGILQSTALLNKAVAGVYAAVARGGSVRVGDGITVGA